MPQIPVEVDDEGYLRGVFPDEPMEIGDVEYRPEWFQYCGVQTYPGVQPGDDKDNYFRYADVSGETVPGLEWMRASDDVRPGEKMHVEHFSDYEEWGNGIGDGGIGKPARGTWRSKDASPQESMVVEVVRSTNVEGMGDDSEWLSASTGDGFIAYPDKCTHFCCVPSFKGLPRAGKFDAEDMIFCTCHQSAYDPFSVVREQFAALPRPE